MPRTIEIAVKQGDITEYPADVVALKYAQHFYGADKAVANALVSQAKVSISDLQPPIGKYRYVPTKGSIKAPYAFFLGVVGLMEFRYEQVRDFAASVLRILADEAPRTRHIAMTIHGAGYGLDEEEACRAQFEGCLDSLATGQVPVELERISFVELLEVRVQRFQKTLDELLRRVDYAERLPGQWAYRLAVPSTNNATSKTVTPQPVVPTAGISSGEKSHAFIAMPFKKEMDDVFYYGIEQPVHNVGLLCERVDKSAYTGGIMDYVKNRIETASVVIAELTEANPNVYLEVGYAWGKGRPTILLSKNEEALHFDVKGQKCLVYERIKDLEEGLAKELKGMIAKGIIQVNDAR